MVKWVEALAALATALSGTPAIASGNCQSDLLPRSTAAHSQRPVSPLDLARLRDFGKQDAVPGGEAPFSISPDGELAALVLRRGDPASNSYCIGVLVVPLDGVGEPRLVDVGGEFILNVSDVRGIPDLPIGNAKPVTPQWSPDGRFLAYLRRDAGLTRVWIAHADGSGARAVSHLTVDARAVSWSRDGRSLLVTTRPGIAVGEAAIDAEARSGFLYDRRFWTLSKARPAPPLPIPFVVEAIDAADGRHLSRGPAPEVREEAIPADAVAIARSRSGAIAWTSAGDPALLVSPVRLSVRIGGRTIPCRSSFCAHGVAALWWSNDGELFFLQSPTPENGGITRLIRWQPETGEPRLILATADALFGCQAAVSSIVCARETSTRPRHLVRIDPRSGAVAVLYDPNPEFADLELGRAQRLRWTTPKGARSYGDLVLPPGHRPGARHPLIVVQYESRGFLRGGTGDEYPVQAFAARGFAVLSVERTTPIGLHVARTNEQLVRIGATGFAERRRVLASVEAGVRSAIALGVVDPQRIGITGLSDGAATVQYALANSTMFKAAAMSSCCDEPASSMFAAGPGYADLLIQAGFPPPGSNGSDFWRHYSLAANASRIHTPILLQVTDDEFRFALQSFVTLKRSGVPIEMYVFPGEYHQKWQPAHRLATYERAIAWFDFWLNGNTRGSADKQPQFARWRKLAALQKR